MALHPCEPARNPKQLPRPPLIEAGFTRRTILVAFQRLSWREILT